MVAGIQSGPMDAMEEMHGALMHADQDAEAVARMHQALQEKAGPEDQKSAGPSDAMAEMHGVMMHGDSVHGLSHNHDHARATKADPQIHQVGPDPNELHGVLMHGDSEAGKDHSEEDHMLRRNVHGGKSFNLANGHDMLHGDGADAAHEHDKLPEVNPKHRGIPSVEDIHAALHGDFNKQMETVTLGKAPPEDADDFQQWSSKKDEQKDGKDQKDAGWGFSFPFISDSILNELEIMKRRYLSRFWATEEDDVAYKEKDLRLEKSEPHDILEDLAGVGDTGPDSHPHDHSNDKSRRDL